jgi:hypothetical protein
MKMWLISDSRVHNMHFTRVGPSLRTLEEEWTGGTRLLTGATISQLLS